MAFDITKHQLVPSHSKVSSSEKEKLFGKYHLSGKELPKISKDDPSIAKLDVKVGEVIKIERASKTAGKAVYFRLVVE